MERESFSDDAIAQFINERFVAVKVDREERPDIDAVYMQVCIRYTGSGGWPLTIVMDAQKRPFFAGTYLPPRSNAYGTGLWELTHSIDRIWRTDRQKILSYSQKVVQSLNESTQPQTTQTDNEQVLHKGYAHLMQSFDSKYGGFSKEPKFPSPHQLYFLLRYAALTQNEEAKNAVETTLQAMAAGGIYDHIGFGFSRYSTDRYWLVPHFEKMLYDNALLAIAYVEAYAWTHNKTYADVANEIFTYLLRDMKSPKGAFYTAQDADTQGVEGLTYLWSYDEIQQLLGTDAHAFCRNYGVTKKGNFEGLNILHRVDASNFDRKEFEEQKNVLLQARQKREQPFLDDKILSGQNGLVIAALAIGARVLKKPSYLTAAANAYQFVKRSMIDENGRLYASYREGKAYHKAYLDDYQYALWGALEMFGNTLESEYLEDAVRLMNETERLFSDSDKKGYALYGKDSEKLISRPRETSDGAMPCGNTVALSNLLRLWRITSDPLWKKRFNRQFAFLSSVLDRSPASACMALATLADKERSAFSFMIDSFDPKQTRMMLDLIGASMPPGYTVTYVLDERVHAFPKKDAACTVYTCGPSGCMPPVTDPETLAAQLENLTKLG